MQDIADRSTKPSFAVIANQVRLKREAGRAKEQWQQIAKEANALAKRAYVLPGPKRPWGLLTDAAIAAEELGK